MERKTTKLKTNKLHQEHYKSECQLLKKKVNG